MAAVHPIIRLVATFGIVIIVGLSVLSFAGIVLVIAPEQRRLRTRLLIGFVPGLIGAIAIAAVSEDLLPDALEPTVFPLMIIFASLGIAALAVRNLVMR
jgi:hypothetical protein